MNTNPQPLATWHPAVLSSHPIILFFTSLTIVIPAILILYWWLESRSTKLSVDQHSLYYEAGLFSKTRAEIRLRDLRSMRVDQSFKQRLFEIGTLNFYTAGDRPEIKAKNINFPNEVKNFIRSRQN